MKPSAFSAKIGQISPQTRFLSMSIVEKRRVAGDTATFASQSLRYRFFTPACRQGSAPTLLAVTLHAFAGSRPTRKTRSAKLFTSQFWQRMSYGQVRCDQVSVSTHPPAELLPRSVPDKLTSPKKTCFSPCARLIKR